MRLLAKQRELSVISNMHEQQWKNNTSEFFLYKKKKQALSVLSWKLSRTMKKVKLWASRRVLDDDWQASVISHSHAWLWHLQVSSSSSLTFSSVRFKWRGVQAPRKMLMWFPSSLPHQLHFSFSSALNFHLIKLITGQETEGAEAANSKCSTSNALMHAHLCSWWVSEIYVQKKTKQHFLIILFWGGGVATANSTLTPLLQINFREKNLPRK